MMRKRRSFPSPLIQRLAIPAPAGGLHGNGTDTVFVYEAADSVVVVRQIRHERPTGYRNGFHAVADCGKPAQRIRPFSMPVSIRQKEI